MTLAVFNRPAERSQPQISVRQTTGSIGEAEHECLPWRRARQIAVSKTGDAVYFISRLTSHQDESQEAPPTSTRKKDKVAFGQRSFLLTIQKLKVTECCDLWKLNPGDGGSLHHGEAAAALCRVPLLFVGLGAHYTVDSNLLKLRAVKAMGVLWPQLRSGSKTVGEISGQLWFSSWGDNDHTAPRLLLPATHLRRVQWRGAKIGPTVTEK
ncbi:unnamed protein product [Pleuronectes platessa]|uniref:Uncharacterized protein n=1 Tax=Pleuronectes platessa TaxID=8262 RepID=A0A9N7VL68_PLEPL|nr:unnamed protein product [Pleuronectes platessa]